MTARRPSRRFRAHGLALACATLLLPMLSACGPSSYDVYLEGLQIEGDAERNACRLVYDEKANAHILDSRKVAGCLERNQDALAKYEEAKRLGQEGKDFERSLEDARARVARLESMLRTVRMMESQD